jgi:hypothetical protein
MVFKGREPDWRPRDRESITAFETSPLAARQQMGRLGFHRRGHCRCDHLSCPSRMHYHERGLLRSCPDSKVADTRRHGCRRWNSVCCRLVARVTTVGRRPYLGA